MIRRQRFARQPKKKTFFFFFSPHQKSCFFELIEYYTYQLLALYYLNYPLSMLIHGKTPPKLAIIFTNYSGGAVLRLTRKAGVSSSPVLVVHVLAYERVWLHRAVRVHLGHVHVVYEVNEPPAARGAVVAAGFLLQGFFQHGCVGDEPGSRVQGK